MIDLHNHMLPGLDDGASTWEDSLAMARLAVEDGIQVVVCTPHWTPGLYDNTRSRILPVLAAFQEKVREQGIPLTLCSGSELRLDFNLGRRIESGELLTLNDTGRYALIELPDGPLPQNLENFFWDLQVQNITPILGHPERNAGLMHHPMVLYRLVEKGVLTQITAAGLSGRFGSKAREFCLFLLEHRLVHFVGTDAHGLHVRTPVLSQAIEELNGLLGEDAARELVVENPNRVLRGEPFSPPAPLPVENAPFHLSALKKVFAFFGRGRH